MTWSQVSVLLNGAGFAEIDVTVQHRYHPDELLGKLPAELQGDLQRLEPTVLQELMGCFTSEAIRGKKREQ
jgi:hypothetical protein